MTDDMSKLRIQAWVDFVPGVRELAARLGVEAKPTDSWPPDSDLVLKGEDGRYYSLIALIAATLDRLDVTTRDTT